jgi:small subunit ribosomal protein S5
MRQDQAPKEFEEKIVQVNRVSKKTKGGNKIGFSVLVVVGDKKGRVGVGLGGAPDVASAVRKAVSYAKKHLIVVPMRGTTIPHEVHVKLGAAQVLIKPAPAGTGVIAGGAVRAVVEAAGISDIVSKILGSKNQASNVYAALEALKRLKSRPSNKPAGMKKEKHVAAEETQTTPEQSTEKVEKKVTEKVEKKATKPKKTK